MAPTGGHSNFIALGPSPCPSTAGQHLDEVARILALGILRLAERAHRSGPIYPDQSSEFRLDFGAGQSVSGLEPAQGGEGP